MGVFEIRLAAGDHPVDFSIRLANFEQARHVASKIKSPHLKGLLTHGWHELGYPSPISSLWLEFDLDLDLDSDLEEVDTLPVPIVCAKLTEAPEPVWLIDRLLPALHGRPLGQTQDQLIRHCLKEIPDGWRVLYAFSLRPRHEDTVRLELYGEDASCMGPYLRRIGMADAADRIESLSRLYQECDRYHLSFDVEEEISSRIGVEYAYERQPRREPRWEDLLDRLVKRSLCRPEKKTIMMWVGQDSLWTASSTWPLAKQDRTVASRYFVRGFSHLKVSHLYKSICESKIYLLISGFDSLRSTLSSTPRSTPSPSRV